MSGAAVASWSLFGLSGRALFFSLALSLLVVSRSLLVTATKSSKGYEYDPASVVLLTEVLKFGIAFFLFFWENRSKAALLPSGGSFSMWAQVDRRTAVLYAVPAVVYAVQNNLVFVALTYLSPPLFELFANLKIITTAVLFRIVMAKPLSTIQVVGILLLFIGAVLGQLGSSSGKAGVTVDFSGDIFIGFIVCVIYATLSAFAGIFSEKLLKESKQSTHLQNMEIYAWSMIVTAVIFKMQSDKALFSSTLLTGYNMTTWIVILNGALMGQCVSFVMKYADNVIKTFAACLAMFLSTLLSAVFFGFLPSLLLVLGFVVTSLSLFLYLGAHNKLLLEHDARAAKEHELKRLAAMSPPAGGAEHSMRPLLASQ